MSLIVTGPSSMPLWFEALSGNSSDKANFHDSIDQFETFNRRLSVGGRFCPLLSGQTPKRTHQVVDSGASDGQQSQSAVHQSDDDVTWTALDNGYKAALYSTKATGEVWALISSKQAYKMELMTFNNRIGKALEKAGKVLKKRGSEVFDCENDALKAGEKWAKTLKYHEATFTVKTFERDNKRGKENR